MKIVVGYDGSDAARRALERAVELDGETDPVTVISVVEMHIPVARGAGSIDPSDRKERLEALREAERILRERGVEVRAVEGHGDPARTIVAEARDSDADIVVVGTRGRGGVKGSLLGSVSTSVVHRAPCDVMVVR